MHWYQSDLSKYSSVKLDTIRKIEQGHVAHPSFFIVLDLANALEQKLEIFKF